MYLLRSIDQQEEQRECARSYCAPLERQSFNLREKLIERASIRCAESPRTTSFSKILDCLECRLAFEAANHATERGGEPSHILVERDVLSAHRRTRRHLPLYFLSGHSLRDQRAQRGIFLLTARI